MSKNGTNNTTVIVKGGFSFFDAPLTDDDTPVLKARKGKKPKVPRFLKDIFG